MSSICETDNRGGLVDKIIVNYLERARSTGSEQNIRSLRQEILAENPEHEKELTRFFENDDFVSGIFARQDSLPHFGDDYEVLEEIGHGGKGIVYKVRQRSLSKIVAIKTIIEGPSGTARDLQRIREEALKVAGLRHSNIVPVHHVDITGRFFVMDYIQGKNLDDFISEQPLSVTKAVEYLKPVADAIHHAHQRGILHCDLNPRNVLIEHAEEEKPYVTDFDLASRIGETGGYLPSAIKGTLAYMAPEQMAKSELTTATDIYGMGGLLYKMLTGRPPFQVQGKTWGEIEKLLLQESPIPPSKWNLEVDKDLEAICLKCLSKDKGRRYGSAYGLKRDLERYQAGEPTDPRPWGRKERVVRWCVRNPGPAVLIPTVALVSILTLTFALLTAKDRKAAQLQEALQSNRAAAKILAGNAFSEIGDLSSTIRKAAHDPKMIGELANLNEKAAGNPKRFQRFEAMNNPDLEQYVETLCRNAPPSLLFQDCFVLDERGYEVADYRIEPAKSGEHKKTPGPLDWRDYFDGAKAQSDLDGGNSVHIGKVYRSITDQFYKLPISAPVLNRNRKFLGVICIALRTDGHLGLVIPGDPFHKVALIAPEDKEGITGVGQSQPVILFHPAYKPGFKPVYAPNPVPPTQITDNYTDPVGSVQDGFKGRWIAGFAQVGNTAMVMIVQQRYEEAVKSDPSTWYLRLWTFAVLLLVIIASLVWLRLHGRNTQSRARIAPIDSPHSCPHNGSI
jgi:eukaryotic-like serine/threonine-protein kinase